MPSPELKLRVWEYLDERRLVTCHQHVVGPQYVDVSVWADVVQIPKAKPEELLPKMMDRLADFFDPIRGGPDHGGWPFGRPVLVSEVHQVIEETPGVDHVNWLTVSKLAGAKGEMESSQRINLERDELVRFDRSTTMIRLRVFR